MNEYKEIVTMNPRRRNKTQIVISISLIVLIFVIYQVLSNSSKIWNAVDFQRDDSVYNFQDEYESGGIFSEKLKNPKTFPFDGEKLVHLDLKGAPPLVSYYRKFFPYIRSLGATGLLIEYEDMFFYRGELEDIRALNAYSPTEIKEILRLAETNHLKVIPLIQTFGHLGFVLKLEKYKDLRELKSSPLVICPSHEKTQPLIQQMIDQVMKAHPNSKYIHIGSDEIMHMGKCKKCRDLMFKNNWSHSNLFLNHVISIASYINRTYPGVRPIMWNDMITSMEKRILEKSTLPDLVDLMVWKYVPNVADYLTKDRMKVYATLFKSIWIASAFKGATGPNQIVTNTKYHLANNAAWMDIVSKWSGYVNFKGIAITGWQRYDHFSGLCELLPVGLPTLTLVLHYLSGSEKDFNMKAVENLVVCQKSITTSPVAVLKSKKNNKCDFPGSLVFQLVNKFSSFTTSAGLHFSISSGGWFSVYNIIHKFSNHVYVKKLFEDWPIDKHLKEMKELREEIERALSEIYDQHTVQEWILTNVSPIWVRLEGYYRAKETILSQKVWPRRPFPNLTKDFEKSARELCTAENQFGCALLLL